MEDHTYSSGNRDGERERRPLNKRSAKQIHDQQRQRTRVYIGGALRRWRALMRDRGFQSHAEVAAFLMDSYERDPATSTYIKREQE
ncbi:hypothetical protein F2P81_021444 [Scophthalmus maximus]|uniref:Uncharacterized protein n=1 Tax=Scophthalmus maximus TaxID=52904 RepID=A0A6A4S175_SCOMX|nr:hypothetical protein F2P81_021444 [Scophthalmus maximus]